MKKPTPFEKQMEVVKAHLGELRSENGGRVDSLLAERRRQALDKLFRISDELGLYDEE